MTAEYSLDVVFNSATTPLTTGTPPPPIYAMGFGFAESPSGTWKEDGQQVELVPDGATFYFSVFDTAPATRASVTGIDVTFTDPDNPDVVWPYSPLAAKGATTNESNPISSPPSSPVVTGSSPGCNVANAAVWRLGPYTVMLPAGLPFLTLACTVQITVAVDPNDESNIKVFSVDPEIQVDGGGGG